MTSPARVGDADQAGPADHSSDQPAAPVGDAHRSPEAPASLDAVSTNSWTELRRHTPARIALGRAGVSTPTSAHLEFQLAHAQARDAVHCRFDAEAVVEALGDAGESALLLHSAAADRQAFLKRPDLGRRLDDASQRRIADWLDGRPPGGAFDAVFVVADGLSPLAIHRNAPGLLRLISDRLTAQGWLLGPTSIVEQGRVAIGDQIAELLAAEMVVVLIGERPGLSSTDSLGIYLTQAPHVGTVDASRNCISNVREAGLGIDEAAFKLAYLMTEARRRQVSGVALKDETRRDGTFAFSSQKFLLHDE